MEKVNSHITEKLWETQKLFGYGFSQHSVRNRNPRRPQGMRQLNSNITGKVCENKKHSEIMFF